MKRVLQLGARAGSCFLLLCGVIALLGAVAAAKRIPPRPVPPITSNGVRYSVDGDGRDEYVVAQDVSSEKVLWKVRVFRNRIDPFKEEDVQWVFINELKLNDKTLLVRDEKARCYAVDLARHAVKKQACGNAP